MAQIDFEEVWRLLHQLEGTIVGTLVQDVPNRIVRFEPNAMIRVSKQSGSWGAESTVRKKIFRGMWDRLTNSGSVEAGQGDRAIAAACLVKVRELCVEYVEGMVPRTIVLRDSGTASQTAAQTIDDEDAEQFGDLERIVADPDICSGKPTIRGTRIMVSNILGMLAGEYSFNRILREYPQLSRLDVIAAVAYASWVVDREKGVA